MARDPARFHKRIMANRDEMLGLAQGGGLESLVIPKLPYTPPPVDPRQMPAWYERWYRSMEDWREKANQAIIGTSIT